MKTISLWQPWAELLTRRLKLFETRSWACAPGEVVIHAAKKIYRSEDYTREFRTQLLMDEVDPYWLKYGVVLCLVNIVACHRVEDVRTRISDRELMYGNYDDGRFAWEIDNVRVFPKPIAVTGHQGFSIGLTAKRYARRPFSER